MSTCQHEGGPTCQHITLKEIEIICACSLPNQADWVGYQDESCQHLWRFGENIPLANSYHQDCTWGSLSTNMR